MLANVSHQKHRSLSSIEGCIPDIRDWNWELEVLMRHVGVIVRDGIPEVPVKVILELRHVVIADHLLDLAHDLTR